MKLVRLRLSKSSSQEVEVLKRQTGLTPNLLCRIALCMSLEEPNTPDPSEFPSDSDREIDRYTLLGAWDPLFVALLKERLIEDKLPLDDETLTAQFRAHIGRGVSLLGKRVSRQLTDVTDILETKHRGGTSENYLPRP